MEGLEALLTLLLTPGVGDETLRKWWAVHRTPRGVMKAIQEGKLRPAAKAALVQQGINNPDLRKKVERILADLHRRQYGAVTLWDDAYPFRLREIPDAPFLLFHRAECPIWDFGRVVAVVGSRRATDYGRRMLARIMEDLATYQPLIVSGLAYGVDTWAHTLAIEHGLPTIAVLGYGFDHIYPPGNRRLAEEMPRHGGDLVTEFFPWQGPERYHFPQRNRIIAGLADFVLVVESEVRGGAMITARQAFSYDRDVGALVGPADAVMSTGPHHLIKTQMAHLITSADDIASVMGWEKDHNAVRRPPYRPESPAETAILRALIRKGNISMDEIAENTGLPLSELSAVMLNLEFQRVVENVRGQTYRLIAQIDLT